MPVMNSITPRRYIIHSCVLVCITLQRLSRLLHQSLRLQPVPGSSHHRDPVSSPRHARRRERYLTPAPPVRLNRPLAERSFQFAPRCLLR
jgi:hypothetical protein